MPGRQVICKNEVVDMSGTNTLQNQYQPHSYTPSSGYSVYSPITPSSGGGGGGVVQSSATNRFFYNEPTVGGGGENMKYAPPPPPTPLFRRSESGYAMPGVVQMEASPPSLRRASFPSGGSLVANAALPPPATAIAAAAVAPPPPQQLAPPGAGNNALAANGSMDTTLLSLQQIKNFASAHNDFSQREWSHAPPPTPATRYRRRQYTNQPTTTTANC